MTKKTEKPTEKPEAEIATDLAPSEPEDEDTAEVVIQPEQWQERTEELIPLIEHYGVHAVFGSSGDLNAGIEQNPQELAIFLARMESLGASSILEIGTGYRGGLSRFLAAELKWQVTTVDVEYYGHAFPKVEYYILGDGEQWPDFADHMPWDVVLIDAKMDEAGFKAAWNHYKKFATVALAMHDIAGLRDCEDAQFFWESISNTKAGDLRKGYFEIIAEGDQRGGIGYYLL